MRRVLIWLVLLTVFVGCGGSEETLPTQVPLVDEASPSEELESPRDAGPGLPPTWTPAPEVRELATPEPAPSTSPSEGFTYRVQPGDTLGEIAERFDVSVALIAAANFIEDIDIIEVDQLLLIPRR
jgi:LysM repeat protein